MQKVSSKLQVEIFAREVQKNIPATRLTWHSRFLNEHSMLQSNK